MYDFNEMFCQNAFPYNLFPISEKEIHTKLDASKWNYLNSISMHLRLETKVIEK